MKLQTPDNANYAAVVVTIKSLTKLEGSDFLQGTPLLGYQAIVGLSTKVGEVGIVFPPETQLSDEYCRENNLFRHSENNKDTDQAGYIEDNRRVKAMKFRGNRSDCLFMPLDSLAYTKVNIDDLKEGDVFDVLEKHEICKKYVIKRKTSYNRLEKNSKKLFQRVDKVFLPEHVDSDQYYRVKDTIPGDVRITVTQKLHGTSIRVANTYVRRKLGWHERLARKVGVQVKEEEFDYVYGSRRVIKDVHNPAQQHFYLALEGKDIWTREGERLKGSLPTGYILYAELIGWADENTPIQEGYTYQIPQGTCELYVYRVSHINSQGRLVDLSWVQLKEFCSGLGIKYVPELWSGYHRDFKVEDFVDHRFHEEGIADAVPLDKNSPVDEGVCIRVEGLVPYIAKAKGETFYNFESKMLDKEAVDMEAVGSDEI